MARPIALAALALLALAATFGPHSALAQPVQHRLYAADGSAYDRFGVSVSASGDVAVVGAYFHDDFRGSAYVFRYDGDSWVQEQKLTPADGSEGDRFGGSVLVSGDVAVVGAEWDDESGEDTGSAYVFRYDGDSWVEEQKLTPADGSAGDYFGTSVSVSGDVAVVGAYGADGNGSLSGSAYVFRYDGDSWVQEQKLTPADGSEGDRFGVSASVSGDVAVVGAEWDDEQTGSAYVFRYDGDSWVQEQKLTAADGSAYGRFGVSVSASGDVAVVGAHFDDDVGSAYVFRYDGDSWVEQQKLTPNGGIIEDYFGISVSVSGDVAVVGAYGADGNGEDSGAAYVFDLSTLVATEPGAAPGSLVVHPPVPNPTAESAALNFTLPEAAAARLALYDALGRKVAAVDAGRLAAGAHRLPLDVSGLPAGTYVWRLVTDGEAQTGRLTVVK